MRERSTDPRGMGVLGRLRMLASDTAIYGLASAVNKSFALILFPILTRNMSVADYGRLDLALYATMLVGLVIVWGQDSAVARLFFEDEDEDTRKRTISQALLVIAINAGVCLTALAVVSRMPLAADWFGPDTRRVIALLLVFAPVSGFLSFCQGLLKWTFQRTRYIALALGVPASNLVMIVALSRVDGFGPVTALAVMTGVSAVFALAGAVLIRRWLILPRDIGTVRPLVSLALPYGIIAAIGAVTPLAERALVSGRFGTAELGLYAAASKLASLATMLAIAFQMGWGPFSYSIYRQADAPRTYNLVLRAFTALMCLAVLALSALADPLVAFLAGDRYRGASLFVFPIAMAFGVQAIGWITEIGIHLSKRAYFNLFGFGAFLLISLGGMLFLSDQIGMIGVPIGVLAGQVAMLLISAAIAQRAFPIAWDYRLPAATVSLTLATGATAMAASGSGTEARWIYGGGFLAVAAINLAFGLATADRRKLGVIVRTLRAR